MSRCISSHGEYSEHELDTANRCQWCRVWECPACGECGVYPLDGDAHDCVEPDEIEDCDATYDVAPDGLLFCTREAGHPGSHLGAVWWIPRAPALDVIVLPDRNTPDSGEGR